jgi:hypothetical protein
MKNFQTRSPLPRACWYSPLARGLALRPSGPVMYARLLAALMLAGAFASQSASTREHLYWPMRRTTAECRAEAGSCRIAQIRRNCSLTTIGSVQAARAAARCAFCPRCRCAAPTARRTGTRPSSAARGQLHLPLRAGHAVVREPRDPPHVPVHASGASST